MKRVAAIALTCAIWLALCSPALAATWTQPDVTVLQGSLIKGGGAWLELPWSILRTIPDSDPRSVVRLANGDTLVTNSADELVYVIDAGGAVVWSFGNAELVPQFPSVSVLAPFNASPLANGNVLITYRQDYAVVEVDRATKQIVRTLGVPTVQGELVDPFRAVELPPGNTLGGDILIADNQAGRVVAMRWDHTVTWEFHSPYGGWPKDARYLPTGNVLITDGDNSGSGNVVYEVTPVKTVVWQYGTPGTTGNGPNQLNGPVSGEPLGDGTILITEEGNDRAIRVDADHNVVWEFSATSLNGLDDIGLMNPGYAVATPTGSILIADEGNNRIVELGRAQNGLVTSAQLDCGLPGARKRFSSITADVDAPAGTSYTVGYSVDGGAWKALSGTAIPANTFGKLIRYRVTLTSTRHDLTPRLLGATVGYAAAPAQSSNTPGNSTGTGGSGSTRHSIGTGSWWLGTGTGTGTGTSSDGVKQGGTGFTSGGTIAVSGGLEGALSTQRGWAMAQVSSTTLLGGRPGSAGAPSPSPGGLVFLGALYTVGALSVPLHQLLARLLGRTPLPV